MPKLGNTLDANDNKVVNAIMDPRAADPAVLSAGKVWFRTDLKQLCFYDGTAVQRISLTALAGTAPVGQVAQFGGAAAPAGWVLCDGSAVSRAAYPDLFAVIGTTFGAGDGATTFNVPNFKGRTPVGVGTATATGATAHTLGQLAGEETHTMTVAEMVAHNHGGLTGAADRSLDHLHSAGAGGGNFFKDGGGDGVGNVAPGNGYNKWPWTGAMDRSIDHLHSIGSQGSTAAANNMQPYLGINFIIKAVVGSATGTSALKYATGLATSATSYVITHALGTTDVFVSVRDTTTGAEVLCTVEHTDLNTVTIRFTNAPAANTRRVVVIG
jgi:microcystin-dependent protein